MSKATKNSLGSQLSAWKKQAAKAVPRLEKSPRSQAKKELSDAEHFALAVKDVTPLQQASAEGSLLFKPASKPAPKPEPNFSRAGELEVLAESLNDCEYDAEAAGDLHYIKPGVQQRVVKKLGKGQYAIAAELDLHGLNSEQAHQAVRQFLAHCGATGKSCVRIIHGKGLHSAHSPILKSKLGAWLRRRNEVLAYTSARPVDGGSGAIYVLLKAQ